jgi:hypothetical protein
MRGSIRIAGFTWDPEDEPRASIANRIKRYVQDELNRIEGDLKHRKWMARRRASPTYQRDRAIWEEHVVQGVDIPELAQRHRLSRQYVREVLRVERHRRQREHGFPPACEGEVCTPLLRELPDLRFGIEQTCQVPTDP